VALGGVCTITNTIAASCPTTLSPAVLPNGTVGVFYSATLTGSNGTAPYTFTVPPGTLPAGLTLTSAGVLSGTPTAAVPQTFTITVTDAVGCTRSLSYTVTITEGTPPPPGCPVITLDPTTLPNGVVGVAYSQLITAVGALGTVTWTRTAGSTFPSGLTLTSSGNTATLAGTPTTVILSDDFTIRATDANGCFAELNYKIAILAGVPTLPQLFVWMLALTLIGLGYRQLRQRQRVNRD
jgi:hypothetical protein